MDKYAAQLATYAKFLDPDELRQVETLLRSGRFGPQVTNDLITSAGRQDLGMGHSRIAEGTTDVLGNPVRNTPGITQSRQNLLDFIKTNSGQVTPQAGPPNLQKINQAAQSGQVLQGMDQKDLQILNDVVQSRSKPLGTPLNDFLQGKAANHGKYPGVDTSAVQKALAGNGGDFYRTELFPDRNTMVQAIDEVAIGRPGPAAQAVGADMRRFYGIDQPSAPAPAPKPAAPVSRVIPDAKPIMSAAQPAPAAPQPRPSLTSTPSGPTKVSATPTPRGKVVAAARNPYSATGAPVTRLAGEVVEESPGVVKYIQDIFSGGKTAAVDGAKSTGNALKTANNAMKPASLLKQGGRLAAGTGVLTVLSAASELADEDDPFARNATQAVGNGLGGWGGALGGAALGTAILPGIGTVIGGIGGGILGTEVGSNIAGGLYDAVMGESESDRREQQMIKDANLKQRLQLQQAATARQIMASDLEARLPYMKDAMAIKRQDDMARAERELRTQNDYNYANALNQAMLSAQNQRGIQELALTQYMMG